MFLDRNTSAIEESFLVLFQLLLLTKRGCSLFVIILFSINFPGWKTITTYVFHHTEFDKEISVLMLQCKPSEE